MRRLGIIVLFLGLGGFFVGTMQRRAYDTVEGQVRTAVSMDEMRQRQAWESVRWLSLGAAVIGAVLIVFPGRKS